MKFKDFFRGGILVFLIFVIAIFIVLIFLFNGNYQCFDGFEDTDSCSFFEYFSQWSLWAIIILVGIIGFILGGIFWSVIKNPKDDSKKKGLKIGILLGLVALYPLLVLFQNYYLTILFSVITGFVAYFIVKSIFDHKKIK